jgi:hypothetical protein
MATDNLNRVEKFTDWEQFQSLASELISLILQTDYGKENDKAARDFTAPIASAYGLLTSTLTPSDLNDHVLNLDRLMKHKQRLRKL